jgi:hypothetical protein
MGDVGNEAGVLKNLKYYEGGFRIMLIKIAI